jgi:hypothetical protein
MSVMTDRYDPVVESSCPDAPAVANGGDPPE